jgi:hypothetical protein
VLCERLAEQDVTHGFGTKRAAAGANQGNDDRFHAQSPIGSGPIPFVSRGALPWSSGPLVHNVEVDSARANLRAVRSNWRPRRWLLTSELRVISPSRSPHADR